MLPHNPNNLQHHNCPESHFSTIDAGNDGQVIPVNGTDKTTSQCVTVKWPQFTSRGLYPFFLVDEKLPSEVKLNKFHCQNVS